MDALRLLKNEVRLLSRSNLARAFLLVTAVLGAVGINAFERAVGDYGIEHGLKLTRLSEETKQEKIAVVGAGAAVVRAVSPGAVVAGVPARPLHRRNAR